MNNLIKLSLIKLKSHNIPNPDLDLRILLNFSSKSKKEIFRQSEVLEKKAVRKIPDGSYNAEGFLDNDGISDEPIKIKINIKVKGDKLNVDLSGS